MSKKGKVFYSDCKKLISAKKLDNYVKDQLGRASFSVVLNIASKEEFIEFTEKAEELSKILYAMIKNLS